MVSKDLLTTNSMDGWCMQQKVCCEPVHKHWSGVGYIYCKQVVSNKLKE